MKTNKILVALALPALFAACTAEEIEVASVQQNTLADRALLDPSFAINVNEGVGSRFAWENLNWKFEDGDQFGAAITDVTTQGTVTGTSLIGNYIFSKNEAGNWITDSQMSEGIYQYYSFDGFKTKMARELVAFDLTAQKADLSEADAAFNEYENQLMISPLYTLQQKYSTKALPLEFYSYYGVGAFKFKNKTDQDLYITQIILSTDAPATEKMTVKGRVNPEAFETAAKFVYSEIAEEYVLAGVAAALKSYEDGDITATEKAEKIEAAEEAYEAAIYTADASATPDATKGDKESSFITLDCDNYLLKQGKETTAYMMVPAGEAEGYTVEIKVVDEDGNTWSVYVNSNGVATGVGYTDSPKAVKVKDMDKLNIQRHKTNAIFGKTPDGKSMKTLEITNDNLVENTGYYVDSKPALIKLLSENLGDIKIHNSGDWAIDEEVVEAINEYTGAGVEFTQPIEIKSSVALTEEDELELKNITFSDVTVIGTIKEADGVTVKFAGTTAELNVNVKGTLTIQEGANVTIIGGNYKNIVNSGTLSIERIDAVDSRVIDGTITNKKGVMSLYVNKPVTAEAGTVKYLAVDENNPLTVNSAVALTAGANLEIGQYVTYKPASNWTVPATDDASSKLTIYGVLDNTKLLVKGALENNGVVKSKIQVQEEGSLTNEVGAKMTANVEIAEGATATNNGEISKLYISGELTLGADSETTLYINSNYPANTAVINNTMLGIINFGNGSISDFEIYYNFAGTVEELEAISFGWFNINTLRLTGELTMTRNFNQENAQALAQMANLKKLVMADDASINVKTDVVTATFDEIELEGDAEIKGIQNVSSLTVFTANSNVATTIYNQAVASTSTTKNGYTLTVKGIDMNAVKLNAGSASTATTFAIKAVNAELGDSQKNIPALVKINNATLDYSVVAGAAADKKWQVSENGATAADATNI